MIDIVEISPNNEGPVAKRLAAAIRAAWPDIAASPDRVTIVVGIRLRCEIDLLVFVELETPRSLPSVLRRDGSRSAAETVQAAALIIEVKQLDQARFSVRGSEIFPVYDDGHSRSVAAQVDDGVLALRHFKSAYGIVDFFVHGIGWLTEVDPEQLAGVGPWIVGRDAGWFGMLDAAAQRNPALYGPKSPAYVLAIATIREILVRRRVLTARGRSTSLALSNDMIATDLVDHLADVVGTKAIRLTGRGGSGKTTTLALLAKRLATIAGARVLILTFHRTLRADIARLIDTFVEESGPRGRIHVETATTFFLHAVRELDIPIGMHDGQPDYLAMPGAIVAAWRRIASDRDFVTLLRETDPRRFAYDYVFIDEAQDWTVGERDFIREFYGNANLVLADGLEQLVRRQTACDWHEGIPQAARMSRHLGRSLRMTANIARFANAFAKASGLGDWVVHPIDELPGGRIVIVDGANPSVPELFNAVRVLMADAGAAPLDALTCVPPEMVRVMEDGRRESTCATALRAAGDRVWDACDPRVRDEPPTDPETWRMLQYDSCRGLEGWIAIAFGLDRLVANKEKHPNLAPGERDAPENVARRWLMIALTRAVHTLIITLDDAMSPLRDTLVAVTSALPSGVVEWTTAATCATSLTPPRSNDAAQS